MSEFVDYCSMCGIALTQLEICTVIDGNVVFFLDRRTGSIQLTFCVDCTNKIIEFMEGGLDRAISRRIDIPDQEPIYSHPSLRVKAKKNKDEDGDGGVPTVLPP